MPQMIEGISSALKCTSSIPVAMFENCWTKAVAMMLIVSQIALFCPGALGVASGKIVMSQASEVAAAQATVSFVTLAPIPSNGSITLQFPFGRNGDGKMPFLGTMYGWAIGMDIPIQAVNLLVDGVTIVYMIDDGTYTKQVTLHPDPEQQNRYYAGSLSQFNPNHWNSYTVGRGVPGDPDHSSMPYQIRNQPTPITDYLPFIGSTGKCDISHPSLGSVSTSFIRNGNITITLSTAVPQGPITVTCSGLTIFPMASSFGGLRISTSQEPVPTVVDFDCPVSAVTSVHCSGVFKLGESNVPMLYMTEGSSAWVAVKYTSSTSAAIVENSWTSTNKNFYVSHSILTSIVSVAGDILMVESSSNVYANMSTALAFSKVRDNILGGCYWFKDTHGTNYLTEWMSPYAIGAQIPDAKLGSCNNYKCCSQGLCSTADVACTSYPPVTGAGDCKLQAHYYVLNSCGVGDGPGSHLTLNLHFRMRSGPWFASQTHSIWFRIPLCLLVSGSLSPLCVPVTQGLIAMYSADSWRPADSVSKAFWLDLSGSGNHVTEIGGTTNISVARPVGAPAYIYGAPTAWLKFPVGILPSAQYTLFYVARYNGPTRLRILQGVNTNWLSGFWGNRAGVAHHGSCSFISSSTDLHGSDWVLGSDRSNTFRSNGVDRSVQKACEEFDRLAINTGSHSGETSDFAIQSILVYNVKLSDADVLRVEAFLTGNRLCAAGEAFSFSTFGCLPCARGLYKNSSGELPCTPCPVGSTTVYEGSLSIASCSVFVSPAPPVTSGLVAYYTADSWNNSRWTDLSGSQNHVTKVGGSGSIAVARPAGAMAYVYGPSTAWMQFPSGILPSAQYTLFFVARYNGAARGRILQGVNSNWILGFWNGRSGVAAHDSCGFITPYLDLHGSDWVVGSDRSNSFRSNGVDRTISNGCQSFETLSINTGSTAQEVSDFAIQSILVYNVKLSDADVLRVEAFLTGNRLCAAGEAFSFSTFGCLPCARGLYKNSSGELPCTPCPVGSTTVYEGSLSIASCSVFVSPAPPVTSGLVAYYTADSWNNSRWTDLSGSQNHVTKVGGSGSIAVARPAGAMAYVYGPSTAWMQFPSGILPSAQYTLFFVARYNGAARGRILQGVNSNWILGFWNGRSGVAAHDSCGFITPNLDLHGSDWVVGSDRSNSFRSNGVDRTISNGCQSFETLSINTGSTAQEVSDFAIQSILVYNVKLSDADVLRVEAFLTGNRLCAAGEAFSFSTFGCLPCARGLYKNSSGELPCTPCPVGSTTVCEGSLSIASCNVFGPPVLPVWSTAQLSVARFYLAATSVGSLALFAGGSSNSALLLLWNCSLMVALGRECERATVSPLSFPRNRLLPHFLHFRWPF
jgi:hypothetical protein